MCCNPENLVDGMCCRFPDGNGGCNECAENDDCENKTTPYCNHGICRKCPQLMAQNGTCYDCTTENNITTLKNECTNVCPNRLYVARDSSTSGYCSLPCDDGYMRAEDGKCYPCNYPLYLHSSSYVCLTYCPNKIYVGSSCRVKQGDCEEGYVMQDSYDGSCHRCDSLHGIVATRVRENNCLTDCGDLREIKTFTGTNGAQTTSCALKVCPSEAPVRTAGGACFGCENFNQTYVISEDECYRCDNALALVDGSNRTYCHVCPSTSTHIDFKNNPRGCQHCGFKWDETTSSCTGCGRGRYTSGSTCKNCPADISTLPADKREECVRQVEYLQSDGQCYINTGIAGTNDLEFSIVMAVAQYENNKTFFGVVGTDQYSAQRGIMYQNNLGLQRAQYGARLIEIPTDSDWHTFYLSKSKSQIDSSVGSSRNVSAEKETEKTFGLFGFITTANAFSGTKVKIKRATLQNSTRAWDFIPVLDPNGTPAMFDQVEKKLYYNNGTGTFSYGPEVN